MDNGSLELQQILCRIRSQKPFKARQTVVTPPEHTGCAMQYQSSVRILERVRGPEQSVRHHAAGSFKDRPGALRAKRMGNSLNSL